MSNERWEADITVPRMVTNIDHAFKRHGLKGVDFEEAITMSGNTMWAAYPRPRKKHVRKATGLGETRALALAGLVHALMETKPE